jgi:predicted PurR-regulated permease PerM
MKSGDEVFLIPAPAGNGIENDAMRQTTERDRAESRVRGAGGSGIMPSHDRQARRIPFLMRTDIDRTLKVLLTIILTAVVLYFGWQVLQRVLYPIELFLMGAIVAFILSPAVDYLNERNGFPRPLAILAVYLMMLGILSLLGYLLISPLLNQIQNLTTNLPKQGAEWQQQLAPRLHDLDTFLKQHGIKTTTDTLQSQASGYLSTLGQNVINNVTILIQTSFSFLVNTVLVLVIGFYLLLDGEQLLERLYQMVPESQLSRVLLVQTTVNTVLGGYLRGQLIVALTIGIMAGTGVYVLGLHGYALVVGVLAGILEMVPMLGPWLAAMPALIISAFQPHWWPLTLFVGLWFLFIQQVESNVIGPRITGHAVGLHPLAALMALLAGIELGGILGALFAVPVAGILYVLGMAVYYDLTGRPQPQLQRKVARSGSLFTNLHLGGRIPMRGPHPEHDEGLLTRLPSLRLRRDTGAGAVPRRLADIEAKRDDILRDKLQQRADADRRIIAEQDGEMDEEPAPTAAPSNREPDEIGARAR